MYTGGVYVQTNCLHVYLGCLSTWCIHGGGAVALSIWEPQCKFGSMHQRDIGHYFLLLLLLLLLYYNIIILLYVISHHVLLFIMISSLTFLTSLLYGNYITIIMSLFYLYLSSSILFYRHTSGYDGITQKETWQ